MLFALHKLVKRHGCQTLYLLAVGPWVSGIILAISCRLWWVAFQVADSTYEPLHSTRCAGECGTLWPSLEKVREIFRIGKVLLIKVIVGSIEVEALHIAVKHTQFTAFSHVWADWKGSTTEKVLPSYQVQFFMDIGKSCPNVDPDSISLWIDSLCIPGDVSLCNNAISKMASIYKAANWVIVLDNTILQCTINKVSKNGWCGLSLRPESTGSGHIRRPCWQRNSTLNLMMTSAYSNFRYKIERSTCRFQVRPFQGSDASSLL